MPWYTLRFNYSHAARRIIARNRSEEKHLDLNRGSCDSNRSSLRSDFALYATSVGAIESQSVPRQNGLIPLVLSVPQLAFLFDFKLHDLPFNTHAFRPSILEINTLFVKKHF